MRIVLLKDKKINKDKLSEVQNELTAFYKKHAGVVPIFYIEEADYSDYPTFIDSDGDVRPTDKYLSELSDGVYKSYGEWGTDHVIALIHRDNWKSCPSARESCIWGTNYSNIFHGYMFHYCRWDSRNSANSFGTIYHEMMHSFDAIIYTMLGVRIEPLLGIKSFDREVVHGGGAAYQYIRYQENTDALQYIASYLQEAYTKRKRLYEEQVGLMKQAIGLLEKLTILYRQAIKKKNGVSKNN